MANDENLVSLATRSKRERSEIGKLGAKATNEIKKAKKTLKEQLEIGIAIMTEKVLKNKDLTLEQKQILEQSNILIYDVLNLAINPKVKHETKLRAIDMILDRMHGKPKQEIESKNETNIKVSSKDVLDFAKDINEGLK